MRKVYWNETWSSVKKGKLNMTWRLLRHGRPTIFKLEKDADGALAASATNGDPAIRFTIKIKSD